MHSGSTQALSSTSLRQLKVQFWQGESAVWGWAAKELGKFLDGSPANDQVKLRAIPAYLSPIFFHKICSGTTMKHYWILINRVSQIPADSARSDEVQAQLDGGYHHGRGPPHRKQPAQAYNRVVGIHQRQYHHILINNFFETFKTIYRFLKNQLILAIFLCKIRSYYM